MAGWPRRLQAIAALVAPWLDLVSRAALAQAFLRAQVAQLMLGSQLGAPLQSHWWVQAAQHLAASSFGTTIQALCPLLLLVGLLARPAAVAMLLQVLLLPPPGMTQALGVLWMALLALVVLSGPGPLSLDRLLAKGVATSPIPFARRLAAFYRLLSRRILPVGLSAVRLLVAAGVAPVVGAMHLGATPAMLPSPAVLALCILLALGFLTPLWALVLLYATPFMVAASGERLFWALLLAVLVVRGGGAIGLDALLHWVSARFRRVAAVQGRRHVVVVGGGFGGVAAVRGLAGAPCRITLIDRTNYTLFQPLLYQVATAGLSPAEIATPIRSLFRGAADVRVLLGDVTGIDCAAKRVRMADATIDYDYLVIATGARHAYLGHDEWAMIAPGLKSVEDATDIRRRLLLAFERAEGATDMAERAAWLTFVVVGGGPTGVELAGAIVELARVGMAGEFRNIDPAAARVVLVQSAERLLPGFPEALSAAALASLQRLGVEVLLQRKLNGVTAEQAIVRGEAIATRTVLWAAGVMASSAAQWLDAPADRAGRVMVAADLSVPGQADVFVIGDTAASLGWNGKAVPGLAPAAKQGGAYVARVIGARLRGGAAPAAFRYRHFGNLATIGRNAAVVDFGSLRLHGSLAWWVWGLAHITFLADARSRVAVVGNWIWAYLTFRRSTRLITFPPTR